MAEKSQTPVTTDSQDPDQVDIATQALASLCPGDEEYLSALDTLTHSLMSRFAHSGNPKDLDEGISRTRQVLDLAPPGHSSHLPALCNMGQALIKRFKFRGDANDLTQAIDHFEAAVGSCTPDQPFYLQAVGALASGLLNRYWRYGDVKDLDKIIETCSTALSASPSDSPNRDVLYNNFANALKDRFIKKGNRADLDAALGYYQSCLDLRPPGHPLRYSVLGNLGDSMLIRFELNGDVQDLQSSADYFESALQLRSPGQAGYIFCLMTLGIIFLRFFHALGDAKKMERAIDYYKTAMEHSTVLNLDHSRLLDNYSTALQARFTMFGNVEDLDQAIQYLTTSLEILPTTYPGRPITLFNLGHVLFNRYNTIGNPTDLDSSIAHLASALELCEPGFHQRPGMLSVYGRALAARFGAKGDMEDLNLAVSACKDALSQSSPKEVDYASTVANLTSTLLECFYKSGNIEECQTIIDYCDGALTFTSPTETAFTPLRINRAKAFLQKFQYGREEADIDTCVAAFRDIMPTLSEGHAEYVPVHLQFGIALETRFRLSADPKDLEESIALYRVARRGCQRGDSNYVKICIQLGNVLRERFDHDQDTNDALNEGIVLLSEVEEILSPTPEQFDYRAALSNLAHALSVRYHAQRNAADLDNAITLMSRTLTLPHSHGSEFIVPFNLATLLSMRYDEQNKLEDLERSIELFATAAEQMPPKHLARGMLCRNYGHALVKLGDHRDLLQNLEAAIVFYNEALEHLPPSHYDQPLTYMRLAEALYKRAEILRNNNGIHGAIKLLRDVMEKLPEHSPMLRPVCLCAAQLSMGMYELSGLQVSSFMEDGFRYYEKAAGYIYASSFSSVTTALKWVEYAEKYHHPSALRAYQTSLDSLNHHLLTSSSVKSRHAVLLDKHWSKQTSTLAADATACAIAQGELELAVELSEQGRGLLWSQMAQGRTPLDALRSSGEVGRALASDFERVSTYLAQSIVNESPVSSSRLTTEELARRYRQSSKELEDVIARIRQQEGFQSFLGRSSFQTLRRAALGGPVILVNVSRQRCDAVIVLHDGPPRVVPLPNATLEDLATLSTQFYDGLKTTSRVGDEKARERQVVVLLRALWDSIVHPIVDALTPCLPRGARVWWCPTSKLTSLPLHAAGTYRKGGQNLPNLYIPSYTPTLAALLRARSPPARTPSTPPAFVAIGQAKPTRSTADASASAELQTVDEELALVRSLAPRAMPFSTLTGDASTADAALGALGTHAWAHLACHGRPNLVQPFDASFVLRDRAVTLLDVVRNARPGGDGDGDGGGGAEFAFLSACHTAVTDGQTPDEIVHLAAAMQFAGFRSVIGTMWAVDDGMAHHMVRAFYAALFAPSSGDEGRGGWDATRAAWALNRASKSVDKDAVTIDQRIVFIHIGV